MKRSLLVSDFLRRAAWVYPHRLAVIDEPEQVAQPFGSLTYAQFQDRANGLAAYLDDISLPVGGRVAIVSHNAARFLAAFYGVCGSGRVLVPINYRLTRDDVAYIVDHSGADVLLVDPELSELAQSLGHPNTHLLGEADEVIFARGRTPKHWDGDEDATATINYTSGTTARPKGVQLTHRNLWINAVAFGYHLGVSDRDVYLHTLPMFHANGWGIPFTMTGVGAEHVVIRKIAGLEILRRVERHGVTMMSGAPAVINMVLDAAKEWDGPIPGRDRVRVVVAGAPPPTKTIELVETVLGWEFIQIYGLTETSPLLTMNRRRADWDELGSHERARRLGRAGTPVIGTEVMVDAGGEVLARSNTVMASYWAQANETEEALAEGWFHTGDGGFIDDDGYLIITDRKKDVIISGGENVSSIEVEDALLHHPHIREVAVIATPDDKWGEMVTALIVSDSSELTTEEVDAFARTHLAGYKVPRKIEFRHELPRTATGKLQKAALREPYWTDHDRKIN